MLPRPVVLFVGLLGLAIFATPAMAYLDPGAGSMALQALIAALAGAAAFVGHFRQKIMDFFRQKRSDD